MLPAKRSDQSGWLHIGHTLRGLLQRTFPPAWRRIEASVYPLYGSNPAHTIWDMARQAEFGKGVLVGFIAGSMITTLNTYIFPAIPPLAQGTTSGSPACWAALIGLMMLVLAGFGVLVIALFSTRLPH